MDTAAYLTRQGWRGSGHSLHPSGHGIAKPLLISKKNDVLGVGNRKKDALAGQWWLKAFDNTLKQVNIGAADGAPKPVEKVTPTFQRSFYSNALYTNFVKGEGLSGTQTPATKPQTKMGSIRQLDGSRNDGTSLESKEKGRDNNRNSHHASEGSPLVLTIAGSGSGALENEMAEDSQRKLEKNRKAKHFLAPEFNGEKGAAYSETWPLVDAVEETPWLKRKIEDEPWETRKPESSQDKNPAASENDVLDGDPPRKRRRVRKRLREAGYIETQVSGEEKGLADAKMESSDYEVLKDSWSNPMVEERSGKTEGQERQPVEISDDGMDILSKLEEQLSIGTTTGQDKQTQSANGQDQSKQLGMHQQQLTNQEIKETKKMRRKERKLQRAAKWSLEKNPKRVSHPNTDTFSQLADDLSKDHGSASGEWNRMRRERRRNRILGDDAGQPTSSLPSMPRKQRRKKRIVGNNSAQLDSSSPPMPRKQRRKTRILGDNARQPTSSLPPTANHVSGRDKSALLKKDTKRLSVRPSGKRVDGPAKTSRPLSGAANDMPGQGKPAPRKPRRTVGRNEKIFEYDDEPVATPMDAITQFLRNRAAK